ncbi:V-type ATP synthase subunit A [Mesoaciditoga lauensis]|uniref:V-type ATP synthase subunit A n=1 Tax=Mesoaciditoga lauensis TaxID=1495039 RepID=UPI00055D9D3F|nr:V-type ATP synthase subunit A [Mesoaciditoga lauensis]
MDKAIGKIYMINGPVVKAKNMTGVMMHEVVKVGNLKLMGEVISLDEDLVTIEVYEETSGLKPGEPVEGTGELLSVTLGPGIIESVFDGIQRPLNVLRSKSGDFLERGISADALDMKKEWEVEVLVKEGEEVIPGQVVAKVKETESIEHRIMVPPDVSGKATNVVKSGRYRLDTVLFMVKTSSGDKEVKMYQKWPVRLPRPVKKRLAPSEPLITGQRVIDTFFPLSKGGTAAIPGGFGTGKTITQHQLAKWSDADVVVYIGCGERGNEMTEVLEEFPQLKDPRNGRPLMERTILIANTSNMPVSAREASIYTGVTMAEYFRDMGYNVALMADSTSRWAEALREISGRLEEMPAEEGFPPYLSSRLAEFYERAGRVEVLGNEEKIGSVSIIGAVSPPGGDFSEPVTTHTKRFIRCFWALDKSLANARHYPSISWLNSYSEYVGELEEWFEKNVHPDFVLLIKKAMNIFSEDDNLQQIIKLVGEDVLPDDQKLIVRVARILKVGYLQQSAFSDVDAFCDLKKQYEMLKLILMYYDRAMTLVSKGVAISEVTNEDVVSTLMRMKEKVPNDKLDELKKIEKDLKSFFDSLDQKYAKAREA